MCDLQIDPFRYEDAERYVAEGDLGRVQDHARKDTRLVSN